jgi:hypothetical protein
VAPVTPNYQRRGVADAAISRAPERATLPIQPFFCGAPTGEDAKTALQSVRQQADQALRDAREHGFCSSCDSSRQAG